MRMQGGLRRSLALAITTVVLLMCPPRARGIVSIDVGSASGSPGSTVTFQVNLGSAGEQVGVIQNTIAFDPSTPISECTISPALTSLSGWSLRPQGCTPLGDCTHANFVIAAFGTAIADGEVYRCNVKIAANATGGTFPLTCSNPHASDPSGRVLQAQCSNGQIQVAAPTPTATPVFGENSGCQIT